MPCFSSFSMTRVMALGVMRDAAAKSVKRAPSCAIARARKRSPEKSGRSTNSASWAAAEAGLAVATEAAGGVELVGGVDPDPQFVFLVALELRNLVFAGAVRVDLGEVFDDPRQRFGQQPGLVLGEDAAGGPQGGDDVDLNPVDVLVLIDDKVPVLRADLVGVVLGGAVNQDDVAHFMRSI